MPHQEGDRSELATEQTTIDLRTPLHSIPSVGPERAALLAKLRIQTAADLVFHFPRQYEEPASLKKLSEFEENVRCSFQGTVESIDERFTRNGKHMLGVQLEPEEGVGLRLVWFNQSFRKKDLVPGSKWIFSGTPKSTVLNWEMIQPRITPVVEGEDSVFNDQPLPIYGLTDGLKQPQMQSLMRRTLPEIIPLVSEVLPESIRNRLEICSISEALAHIHFPPSLSEAENARRRFKLQELFVLQLAISIQRKQREHQATAPVCEPSGKIHSRILNRLGLTLTQDQLDAISDIGLDMAKSTPMNRLLQGDVGSGKTVVAQYAMLLCVAHDLQSALMAPTEVLAQQHAETLENSLGSSRVRVALITGSMSRAERREILEEVAAGEINLVVGTQALLSDDLSFPNLGLVIVDEQHKFGVLQRAKLRSDDQQPHYLVLSATPIPRTIAMTDFGDLDVSTIREKPPGRAKVHSYLANHGDLESWWKFVDSKIKEGRQAFIIAPRVSEESEDRLESDSNEHAPASAEGAFKELSSSTFSHRSVGLLHGRMDSEDKHHVLQAFARGELDILVATTVVEVGINVPNATLMTILDANRLGLSQLHQLRGRVARGSLPGYVCAVASFGSDESDHERLQAFEKCDDGFELAELDLRIRGPGDLLGTSQSGLPPLRVADLAKDGDLLEFARDAARELLAKDPELDAPELSLLKTQTLRRYGSCLRLSDIG